jgi:hypothetical protein
MTEKESKKRGQKKKKEKKFVNKKGTGRGESK